MYLKSIEVQGFKSFANKIRFEFHNGITCIVGPNGSGKSNVADAVRWVLGEQSAKQLRGSSMQDVIFSGTELRKPLSYAYVAITLDNSDHSLNIDYDEVTVARRVYRSGESEYLMNGNECRLRDVQELFYDTGIGKEGYSIIGQGQIDKILSSKPEDRRELFDEAAGIVKYKRRRNAALKKLDNEHQDLVRVKDIVTELEKQVGPLEKQSRSAREYLKLKESLKFYELNGFLLDYAEADRKQKELEEQIGITDTEYRECEQETEELKARYEEIDAEVQELSAKIDSEKQEQTDCRLGRQQKEGQTAVLREQIASGKQLGDNLRGRTDARKTDLASKEQELISLTGDRKEKEAELGRARKDAEAVTWELEQMDGRISGLSAEVENQKSSIIGRLNDKSAYAADLQKSRTILEQTKQHRAELAAKLIRLGTDEQTKQKEYRRLSGELDDCRREIADLKEEQEQGENNLLVIRNSEQRLAESIAKASQEYNSAHARAEQIRNIAERYEGYGSSIRRIMEVKDRYPGVRGVVADLVKVPKQYEIAIETALGGSIQNIVTDTEQTAKSLIAYLKENRYGRATFLPLDGIEADREITQKGALREKGVIGRASDLVTVDDAYRGLAVYLLGRVLVTDTIDNALAVARKYHHSIRIVTLEGELLSAGGSITGGAFKTTSNLLGRKREIEELEAKAAAAKQTGTKLLAEQQSAREEQRKAEEALDTIRRQLEDLAVRENTARIRADQSARELSSIRSDRNRASEDTEAIEQQIRETKEEEARVSEALASLDQENQDTEDSVQDLSRKLEDLRTKRADLEQKASAAHIRLEACSQSLGFVDENLRRVEDEKSKITEDIASLEEELGRDTSDIDAKLSAIEGLEAECTTLTARAEELDGLIAADEKERDRKQEINRAFFTKREELSDRGSRLDKELYRLNGQKEKNEEHISSIVSYLWDEYELMPSEVNGSVQPFSGTLSEAKKEASGLKNQIKALGPVNVNAIEQYKEVSERYAFLNGQYQDLLSAEDALKAVIADLQSGMENRFREQFANICREFDRVFRQLFGGGKGTLELVEGEEDITEAGIRIIAQPPGKKLQNMMQLSGGEKALTAIALLFAIQNLKPSPFCLLDEIEAALDDSNVGRFADYLKKLTDHTQFILISHRRGTMNSADRLYGITMQEKGVSALVSVNLVEQDLDQ